MPLNLTKPSEGDVGWADEVNQNFTDIETSVNGLGTMAGQDATSVLITGGSISGITDLAVVDGGTGASTAAAARTNLEVPPQTRLISTTSPLTGGGDLTQDRTIALGTVPESNGGTNQTTYASGDILYASAANTLSRLPKGSNGQVLTLSSGLPSWATPGAGGGKLAQVQGATTTSSFACGTIPFDNTKPTSSEGTQILSQAITPTNGSSNLFIHVVVQFGLGSGAYACAALFDGGSQAVATTWGLNNTNGVNSISLVYKIQAGSTSARTYTVRCGANTGTMYVNKDATNNDKYSGTLVSSVTVWEVTP